MLLSQDAFFTQLTKLFENTKEKGSVFLSQKRYTYEEKEEKDNGWRIGDGEDTKEYPCLVRATDGYDTKISTLVQPNEQDKFLTEYGNILKVHMDTLKKKDRKDRKRKMVGRKNAKRSTKDPAKKAKSAA